MARIHLLRKGDSWGGAVSDLGSYSGGSWSASLPLTNLIDTHPKKVARSSNALAASTLFVCDLQRVAPVSLFALINHNVSNAGTIRFRASNVADGSAPLIDETIDLGEANVVWGSLPWGAFPWTGIVEDLQPVGLTTFYQNAAAVHVRYLLVNVVDTGNTDGYVQSGNFKAGDPFVPAINIALGAGLRFIDESRRQRAASGALYSDVRPKRRRFAGNLEFLTQAEAFGAIYDLQRANGITGGLLMIFDPEDDAAVVERRTIYGTLTDIGDIGFNNNSDHPYGFGFAIEELV